MMIMMMWNFVHQNMALQAVLHKKSSDDVLLASGATTNLGLDKSGASKIEMRAVGPPVVILVSSPKTCVHPGQSCRP